MNWLKAAALAVQKPPEGVVTLLKKQLAGWEPHRPMDVVHASDVTKAEFCPRHWALLEVLEQEPKGQYISTAMQITFDVGKATADLFVNAWAGQAVVGNWACEFCGAQRTFSKKPPSGCPKSKSCGWRYREVQFVSPETGVSGSIDVLLDLGAPKLMIVELKIMGVDEFEKLVAPVAEHRIRTNLYMKLVQDSDSVYKNQINVLQAKVLYLSRGFGKKNPLHNEILPIKEYDVSRSDDGLAQIEARAVQIKIFREHKKMPSGICGTALDKHAKACSTCAECFSGHHPAEQPALK